MTGFQSSRDMQNLSRIRNFMLDSQVPSPWHMAEVLGVPALSDEVAERETDASNERVERIELLLPILQSYGRVMAQAHVKHSQAHLSEEEIEHVPAANWEATANAFYGVTTAALIGAVAQMVDSGVLELPKKKWFRRK